MEESTFLVSSLPTPDPVVIEEALKLYQEMINNADKRYGGEPCSLCIANKNQIRDHFHGSEFGKCFRQTQYKIINPLQKEKDPFKAIFLQDGHLHEVVSEELLIDLSTAHHKQEEKVLEKKVTVAEQTYNIKVVTHVDLFFVNNRRKFIIEFKAVKDWYWKNFVEKGIISDHHYGQTQAYLEAYKIDYALLFYKNRHTSMINFPIVIKKDDIYIRRRFNYLAGIQYARSLAKLVPREYNDKKCSACKFCDYHKNCWGK